MNNVHSTPPAPAASKIGLILHAIMFFLSIVVLALSAVVIWTYSGWYGIGGPGYNIFCCIITWIICVYVIVSATVAKGLYNRIVHTVMLAAGTIFWLSAWASMAAWAAAFGLLDSYDYSSYTTIYNNNRSESQIRTGWQCAAAAAGIGALIFLLFIVNFILNIVGFFRDRRARREAGNNAAYGAQPAYGAGAPAPGYNAGVASPPPGGYADKQQYPMQTMSPNNNYGQQDQYPQTVGSPEPAQAGYTGAPNAYPHQPQNPPYPTQ